MSIAKQLRSDIVEILFKTDDVEILESIHSQLRDTKVSVQEIEKIPAFMEGVKPIRREVSLEQIMREQNYKPITYEEFREKADQIEWDISLEELLAALD